MMPPLKLPHSRQDARSFLFNALCRNLRERRGCVRLGGNAVCSLDVSALIYLRADLSLGHNLPKRSRAETYLKMHKRSELHINGYFKAFYNSSIEVFPDGILTLGSGYINSNCVISCAKSITIGDGAAISRNVKIYDSDHHKIFDEHKNQVNLSAPVVIGSNVWIGIDAVILKGVTIGQGAMIAAGAVVTHDIEPNCIAAGVPAKIIRRGINWN
jgi:acetyltransferase-like isoleucine patch superfamily enzyme